MLDSHADTPEQSPAPAVVVAEGLDDGVVALTETEDVVVAFAEDEVVALAEDVDVVAPAGDDVAGAGALDPESIALTAWSYRPFAIAHASVSASIRFPQKRESRETHHTPETHPRASHHQRTNTGSLSAR